MKILIYRIGQLGDTLVSLPVLAYIRESYPTDELHMLSDSHVGKNYLSPSAIIPSSIKIDKFLSYSARSDGTSFSVLSDLLKMLKAERYDILFYLYPRKASIFKNICDYIFFSLCGFRKMYGFSIIFNKLFQRLPPSLSEGQYLINAISRKGFGLQHAKGYQFSHNLSSAELCSLAHYDELLHNSDFPIAFCVGSKMPSKKWPISNYLHLISRLIEDSQCYPVFFGDSSDFMEVTELIDKLGIGLNLCGKLSIFESAHLMRSCKLYVGNDTGAMHLAAAVGLKCVAIFSARDYAGRWAPLGEHHIVLRSTVDCEHCQLINCTNGLKCLVQIRVEDVLASIYEICENS